MPKLTHIDEQGKASMVDISHKAISRRTSIAIGSIKLAAGTLELIRRNEVAKGDVLATARIAAIMGAKQCSSLIPLCHPLLINKIDIQFNVLPDGIAIEAFASCNGQTGIEMEALTAVSVAALTIWDMCKAVDKTMVIEQITLKEKTKEVLE